MCAPERQVSGLVLAGVVRDSPAPFDAVMPTACGFYAIEFEVFGCAAVNTPTAKLFAQLGGLAFCPFALSESHNG